MTAQTDFFGRQAAARRATKLLVLWFALGVIATAAVIYLIIFAVGENTGEDVRDIHYIVGVLAGTLLFIGGVSFFKQMQLSGGGGGKIAKDLGGTKVSADTTDPAERRLLNVVQEMSIASGVPVPDVYVLYNEACINAFAAGTRQEDAAIAVSAGALEKLSRDELQGVVGHEFSHILNGDMRLNVRLLGWIFGLLAISLLGSILMRFAFLVDNRVARSSGDKKGGVGILIIAIGIVLYVVGMCSQFFGKIVQAAISRNREHLADASSTQFTRNPLALANALSRIGGDTCGSELRSPKATEYAHFFFASGFNSIFATHPPLEKRIRLLNPNWDGKFLPPLKNNLVNERTTNPRKGKSAATVGFVADRMPTDDIVRHLAQTTNGARALIFMILMADTPDDNDEQARMLLEKENQTTFRLLEKNWEQISALPRENRIDAVLLAAPALREMKLRERKEFRNTLRQLANADDRISLFEFCLLRTVEGVLFAATIPTSGTAKTDAKRTLAQHANIILNEFLRQNWSMKSEWKNQLYNALLEQNVFPQNLPVLPDSELTIPALDAAFDALKAAPILTKEQFLRTCKKITLSDGKTSETERDLLAALASALGCPVL